MLGNDNFYWGSIYKMIVAFGVVFSDLKLVRIDQNAQPVLPGIKVPCNWAPKEKWLLRNTQNPMPGTDDQIEMILPRMSYNLTGFTYDTSRKLTSTGQTVKAIVNDNKVLKSEFNPVPWNLGFVLNIMAKSIDDGLMIIEQIVPFFTPDYTVSVKDIPDLDLVKDIPIVLNSMSHDDGFDGSFEDRRTITWTLNFTMKGYLYPPVRLTKVNLSTNVFYRIDGESALFSQLPWINTTPFPGNSTAETVSDGLDVTVFKSSEFSINGHSRIQSRILKNQTGVSKIHP